MSFFCCLLLSIVFSIAVGAEKLQNGSYTIDHYITDEVDISDYHTFIPNNGTQEKYESGEIQKLITNDNVTVSGFWKISMVDGSPIVEKGGQTVVTLDKAYYSVLYKDNAGIYWYSRDPEIRVLVYYDDGTHEYFDCQVSMTNADCNVSFVFEPKANVTDIQYNFTDTLNNTWVGATLKFQYYLGEVGGDNTYNLTIQQESAEVGLLAGIKELINKIISGITELGETIANLPAKIWYWIEDGLMDLFVPNETYIGNFIEAMKGLLGERWGAVYEVVAITLESWESVEVSDVTNTIEFPLVTIPLPDNESFSFGGYDVQIVPNGFDFMAIASKTITGMLVTVAFINGLRKRYDEVMGVEQ